MIAYFFIASSDREATSIRCIDQREEGVELQYITIIELSELWVVLLNKIKNVGLIKSLSGEFKHLLPTDEGVGKLSHGETLVSIPLELVSKISTIKPYQIDDIVDQWRKMVVTQRMYLNTSINFLRESLVSLICLARIARTTNQKFYLYNHV
ncbi:MAG: hypothetical protein ACFFAS_12190 [Promethearchaeota archaeon]